MKFLKLALAAVALAAASLPCTVQAGDADFTLVNRTGYPIGEIYLTASHKSKWGPERLGKKVLNNNGSRDFKLGNFADCLQDMMIVFADNGDKVTWEEFDLCELHKITLKYNRKTGEVKADTE
jgi:hypothetical protein